MSFFRITNDTKMKEIRHCWPIEREVDRALISAKENEITAWDICTGLGKMLIKTFSTPGDGWVSAMSFTPDCKYLLSGHSNGLVRVWDYDAGVCIHEWDCYHSRRVTSVWVGSKRFVALSGFEAKFYSLDSHKCLFAMGLGNRIKADGSFVYYDTSSSCLMTATLDDEKPITCPTTLALFSVLKQFLPVELVAICLQKYWYDDELDPKELEMAKSLLEDLSTVHTAIGITEVNEVRNSVWI